MYGRPEAAFVLIVLQSMFWTIAGISAIPFAIAGGIFMLGLGIASLLLALFATMMGIGLLWRRRCARRGILPLGGICPGGSLLVLVLPVGAHHGPGARMAHVGPPAAGALPLRGRKMRAP